MSGPDDIIHQPVRLRIMAALAAAPAGAELDFAQLKNLTGASDGNLRAHIDTLARANYVDVEKTFVARRPRTGVRATAAGRAAFAAHVAFLRALIDQTP